MKWSAILVLVVLLMSSLLFSQESEEVAIDEEGKASYYAKKFQGRKTASGDLFDNYDYTAAHRKLPFNTYLNVVNKKNKFNIIVRVNDRGPFVKNRIIDLSEAAARRIGGYHSGVIPVKIQELTLLKPGRYLDSIFNSSPVVDCFGKEAEPDGFMLSLWKTSDLVHAVYIANDLYLKEDVSQVYIANKIVAGKKQYHILIGNVEDKSSALKLKDYYENKGFMRVTFYQL